MELIPVIKAHKLNNQIKKVCDNISDQITSTESMFEKVTGVKVSEQISKWNTKNIKVMDYMFKNASNFNSDISKWNTDSLLSAKEMFFEANSFNQNIDTKNIQNEIGSYIAWNMSNVRNINRMFMGATNFGAVLDLENGKSVNNSLNNWDVSNIVDMSFLFWNTKHFNANISDWNVSNVVNMQGMFGSDSSNNFNNNFNTKLSKWNVSKVRNMSGMFKNTKAFTGIDKDFSLLNWDVSNVINFSEMFYGSRFEGDISNWQIKSAKDLTGMFARCSHFNSNISKWDINGVEKISYMFLQIQHYDQDLSKWDLRRIVQSQRQYFNVGVGIITKNFEIRIDNDWRDEYHPIGNKDVFKSEQSNWYEKPEKKYHELIKYKEEIPGTPPTTVTNLVREEGLRLIQESIKDTIKDEIKITFKNAQEVNETNIKKKLEKLDVFKNNSDLINDIQISINNQNKQIIISAKTDSDKYQGSIVISYTVEEDQKTNIQDLLNSIQTINFQANTNVDSATITNHLSTHNVFKNNPDLINHVEISINNQNNQITISAKTDSDKYQGSITISYEVEKPTSNTGKVVGGVVGGITTSAGIGGAAAYVGIKHLDKVKYLFRFRRKK